MPRARARRSAAIRTGRRSWRSRSWTGSTSRPRSPRWRSPACSSASRPRRKTLARRCNDYAAELNAKHWPSASARSARCRCGTSRDAVDEVAYCLDTLKFSGVSLFASYDGKFLGDPKFDPVMEALNARDGVVFVHPGTHPTNKLIELPWPAFMMEYLFDTTRAVVNLIFGGALERYPRIRFILPHAGGLVPYFSWRLSVSPMIDKRLQADCRSDEVFALLKRFWYDNALSPGEQTWGCLRERRGSRADRVRHRLAVRQRARHRGGDEDLRGARTRSRPRSAPPSTAATRCGCSRSSRDRIDGIRRQRAPGRACSRWRSASWR